MCGKTSKNPCLQYPLHLWFFEKWVTRTEKSKFGTSLRQIKFFFQKSTCRTSNGYFARSLMLNMIKSQDRHCEHPCWRLKYVGAKLTFSVVQNFVFFSGKFNKKIRTFVKIRHVTSPPSRKSNGNWFATEAEWNTAAENTAAASPGLFLFTIFLVLHCLTASENAWKSPMYWHTGWKIDAFVLVFLRMP